MFLCQEECVANYQRKTSQISVEKKCEHCQATIFQNDDKYFNWQTKYFCSVNCLGLLFYYINFIHKTYLLCVG